MELLEDEAGLFLRGQFNLATTAGRDAFEHVKAGDINGMSFGYRVSDGGASRNTDGTIKLTALDLLEVSVVAMPANRRARITGVKFVQSREELERGLRGEIPLSLPRAAAVKAAAAAWPALDGGDHPEIDFDMIAKRLDEHARDRKSWR